MTKEALKLALEALEQTLETLNDENAQPGGAIADTIWYSEHITLFDYLASEITAIKEALAQPEQEPETFEQWLAKQHGDPEEIGFLQALRIAYISGQDSIKAAHGITGENT
jgi:hypothetical protein